MALTRLFSEGQTPVVTETGDSTDYELGTRFVPSVDGNVTQLAYYRGADDAGDTDTRTLRLWTGAGVELASVSVVAGPGASGWQFGTLSSPIALTAEQTYVVTYGTVQNYVTTSRFFATDHVSADGVLTAPSGLNGVFEVTSTGAFPTGTFNDTNYWTDVIFEYDTAPDPVTGDLDATESGSDSAAATGSALVSGSVSGTEVGTDVAAAQGFAIVSATAAAQEQGQDTGQASGAGIASGALTGTETGQDSASASSVGVISGAASIVEVGADTAAASGASSVSGSMVGQETGADTLSGSAGGYLGTQASLAAVESGSDAAAGSGVSSASSALAAVEVGSDAANVIGFTLITGILSASETGFDTATGNYTAPDVPDERVLTIPKLTRRITLAAMNRNASVPAMSRTVTA